jgi:hypothetical protein
MGFAEDVKAKINKSLNGRIKSAEEAVSKMETTQTQCVTDAASTKLDLMILRKTPVAQNNAERAAKEALMQAKLRQWQDQHTKAEQDLGTLKKDLSIYQGIKTDLQKGALQLIA